jgi:adenylate kinase
MRELKRIGLYGISGIGKTTLLRSMDLMQAQTIWLEGSKLVLQSANLELSEFKRLPENEKIHHRERAISKALDIQQETQKHILIDGHLAFAKENGEFENVMTESDRRFYTDFIYLELPARIVLERQQKDLQRIRSYSLETITNWMEYEKQALSTACLETGANIHFLSDSSFERGKQFIIDIINA